jgi:hypothetical protein
VAFDQMAGVIVFIEKVNEAFSFGASDIEPATLTSSRRGSVNAYGNSPTKQASGRRTMMFVRMTTLMPKRLAQKNYFVHG